MHSKLSEIDTNYAMTYPVLVSTCVEKTLKETDYSCLYAGSRHIAQFLFILIRPWDLFIPFYQAKGPSFPTTTYPPLPSIIIFKM